MFNNVQACLKIQRQSDLLPIVSILSPFFEHCSEFWLRSTSHELEFKKAEK